MFETSFLYAEKTKGVSTYASGMCMYDKIRNVLFGVNVIDGNLEPEWLITNTF